MTLCVGNSFGILFFKNWIIYRKIKKNLVSKKNNICFLQEESKLEKIFFDQFGLYEG